jgi:anti-anti-sigma regulatory factor
MVASKSMILRASERLSHNEAERLAHIAVHSDAPSIILDMSRVLEATTPSLARLVLLRRELLQQGRDLRLVALRGQPATLMEIHRLQGVLPRINDLSTWAE